MKPTYEVFEGNASRQLWADIDAVRHSGYPVWEALYALGCACQRLEAKIDALAERIPAPRKVRVGRRVR